MVWEDKETTTLVELYKVNKDVEYIAEQMDKSPRSIIGKLVSLSIYEIPEETKKDPTVKEMVRFIEQCIGKPFDTENMNKKENVKKLWDWFKENFN